MREVEGADTAAETQLKHFAFRRFLVKLRLLFAPPARRPVIRQLYSIKISNASHSFASEAAFQPWISPSPSEVCQHGRLVSSSSWEDGRVWYLEWKGVKLYVKEGKDVDDGEAKITELARTATGLPIPRVYHFERQGEATFIYLEALPGKHFRSDPYDPLDRRGAGRAIRTDLTSALERLHRIRAPPGTRVGGFGPKPLAALLAEADVAPSLGSTAELHAWLRADYLSTFPSPSAAAEYDTEIAPHLDDSSPLVLVHGDLRQYNLLVQNNRLSGIIDFGRAGWYPEWVEGFAPALETWVGADIPGIRIAEAVLGEDVIKSRREAWLGQAGQGWQGKSAAQ
ncbi:hypothetical protein JCM10213_003271 [Rhodosporidiobolus nylandii]